MSDDIDEKYRVPLKEISCPGCGRKYGHGGTGVDMNTEECTDCVDDMGYEDVRLVSGEHFIENVLGYPPMS